MSPTQIRALTIGVISVVISLCLGYLIASEDYADVILFFLTCLLLITIVMPGYAAMLAFGMLCPFSLPLPYVYSFPFVVLILGLCGLKFALRRSLRKLEGRFVWSLNIWVGLFFLWVLIRYAMNPTMPGIAIGRGEGVTGFRAYFNYLISFGLIVSLGFLSGTREQVARISRWMGIISAVFVVLLAPLIFTRSFSIASVFMQLGMFVTFFDNGWLRFIPLAGFGSILIGLAMLPNLFPARTAFRLLTFLIGLAAIVMAGNRGSLVMAAVLTTAIAFLRRRYVLASLIIGTVVSTLFLFQYIGERHDFARGVGFFRVLAVVSGRVAQMTDAAENLQWRSLRWKRALQDVYASPLIGVGYGGLENAFIYGNLAQYEAARVEIDVAAGSVHNGYIACARALGVPCLCLFVLVLAIQIVRHASQAFRTQASNPLGSELHVLVAANLLSLIPAIYIGMDLNHFLLWYYMGTGFILLRLDRNAVRPPPAPVRLWRRPPLVEPRLA